MKTILLALAAVALAGPAAAGPCAVRIAQLQARYNAAPLLKGAEPFDKGVTGTETAAALLHHQPTPASTADADADALSPASVRNARFKIEIEQAIAAEHAGDEATCEASATQAERALAQ
jgi:hypothetical protein